jgi:hypothetical protein
MSNLSVNDLAVAVKIIDLASERGLFKGVDLKTVGEVRERFVDFIKATEGEGAPETPEGGGAPDAGNPTE